MATNTLPTPKLKEYVFSEKLGSGTYGDVFKVYRKTGAREVYAVKCVLRGKLRQCEIDSIVSEITLLKKLKHPNIVQMEDFAWDSNYIYIIMEYCGQGDLSRYIRAHKVLPESVCRKFLQQLSSALKYLRSENISHMDLKPQNILLNGKVLKLADFGFAQHLSPDQIKTTIRGSPLYMAPEMVLERKYDAKVDIWSVGVILYECLFGKAPYKSETLDQLLIKIKSDTPVQAPTHIRVSAECQDLLAQCLQRDPSKRIDFEGFFHHPFLDMEHMPCEESIPKAMEIIEKAVEKDKKGKVEEALILYRSALEYLVPYHQAETSLVKKESLKKKIDIYIRRAEELKNGFNEDGRSKHSTPRSNSVEEKVLRCENAVPPSINLDILIKLSVTTPALKTALEIAQSAEYYEREGQLKVAIERYQKSLGLLLPILSTEPPGQRKVLLSHEINRWMSRAEVVKEMLKLKEKQDADREAEDVSDRQCSVQ